MHFLLTEVEPDDLFFCPLCGRLVYLTRRCHLMYVRTVTSEVAVSHLEALRLWLFILWPGCYNMWECVGECTRVKIYPWSGRVQTHRGMFGLFVFLDACQISARLWTGRHWSYLQPFLPLRWMDWYFLVPLVGLCSLFQTIHIYCGSLLECQPFWETMPKAESNETSRRG